MGSVCTSTKSKRRQETYATNNDNRNTNVPKRNENQNTDNVSRPSVNQNNDNNFQQNQRHNINIPDRNLRTLNTNNQNSNNTNNLTNNRFALNNSIEDELGYNWRRSNVGSRGNIRRNRNIFTNNDSDVRCPECRFDFNNIYELESHFPYCNLVRNNQAMNNRIHEILNLMHTLNQRVIFDSNRILPQLFLNEINSCDRPSELIDWEYTLLDNGIPLWTNVGKICVKDDEYKQILKVEIEEIRKSKYWKKRFWLTNYVKKYINDSSFEYITLVINRENILEDSFNQFQTTQDLDLTKELKIFFVEEVAQDVGGVYREWYSNLMDAIIYPTEGLFYEISDAKYGKNSFFIPTYKEFPKKDSFVDYYEFIGKILAKAILDRMTIKINLNYIMLKHILRNNIELEDLRHLDYDIYISLKNLLTNTCDKENDLRFVWTIRVSDTTSEEIELVQDGRNIIVDDSNKEEFVKELIHFITYKSIKEKLESFLKGFRQIIKQDVIGIFTPEELDFLISGQTKIDLNDWKINTIYKGTFTENHPTVKLFWEVLSELENKDLLVFFKFCTGSTRVPIDGFNSLQGNRNKLHKFCIDSGSAEKVEDKNKKKLIEANTCFNRIIMPCYKSKEEVIHVINTIIKNDTNYFGKQ